MLFIDPEFYLFQRTFLSLGHDVSMTDCMELGKLIHGHLDVSFIETKLLVELINVAQLPHVLHVEGVVWGLQISIGTLWEVERDLVTKARITDELFQVRDELGIASRLFLTHL